MNGDVTPKPRVLLGRGLPPPLHAALKQAHDCRSLEEASDPAAFIAREGAAFGVYVTTATHGADDALMAAMPQLRAICSLGVGLDAIDMAAAVRRGIRVGYTPDVLNDCVADLAMGLLIDVARGMSRADRHVRRGDWVRSGPTPLGTRVSGRRLGLLGMGRIGQTIARRAAGFDMTIRYHARAPRTELAWRHEPSLHALAEWSDFLVVACAGGEATRGLVNADVIEALGPQGFLVNIARGSVVDEPALVAALQNGRLAGAALDVFASEPQVPEALRTMEQVVLLPHIGSATAQTRRAMGDLLLQNVRAFVDEGTLVAEAPRP